MHAGSPATPSTLAAGQSSEAGQPARIPDVIFRSEKLNSKPIKIPGPDHPITITPTKGRVTATVNGKPIADTREALTLREATYPPVQYIPRKDVDMAQLQGTAHQTYC